MSQTTAGGDGLTLTGLVTEFFTLGIPVQTRLVPPNPTTKTVAVDRVHSTIITGTASSTSVLTIDQTTVYKVLPITVQHAAGAGAGTIISLTDLFTFGGAGTTITTVLDATPTTLIFFPSPTIATNEFAVTLTPAGAQSNSGVSDTLSNSGASSNSGGQATAFNAPTHSAGTTGTTQPAAPNAQVPVGAIVGAILGFVLLLSLGAAALFLRRRRAHRRDNKPRSLGSRTESAFTDLSVSEEELKPRPLLLYDPERALATEKSPLPTSGNSSAPSTSALGASVSTSNVQGRTAATPKATEVALANMAEEVQALRSQVRRLEQERAGIGAEPSVDESPPQYAPGE